MNTLKNKFTLILIFSFFISYAQNSHNSSISTSFSDHIIGGMNCVIVQHSVSDFDTWEVAYIKDEKRRKKSGISEKLILRGADDANYLTVVFELNDVSKGKAFFSDPLSAELMGAAGVTSMPTFTYFNVSNSGIPSGESFLVVRHTVADYEKWESAFNQHKSVRSNFNISLTALGVDLDNPQNVVAIFNSEMADNITSFLEKSDLKEAMKNAGITSKPIQDLAVLH